MEGRGQLKNNEMGCLKSFERQGNKELFTIKMLKLADVRHIGKTTEQTIFGASEARI